MEFLRAMALFLSLLMGRIAAWFGRMALWFEAKYYVLTEAERA